MTSSPEHVILYLLLDNSIYNKYYNNINLNNIKDISKELYILYKYIKELHEELNRNITLEEYKLYVLSKVEVSKRDLFTSILEVVGSTQAQPDLIEALIREHSSKERLSKLALMAYEASLGNAEVSTVTDFAKSFLDDSEKLTQGDALPFVDDNLEALIESQITAHGFRWRLDWLNKSLGSLRGGDFGFIFARPETGKTTFLASEASHFTEQIPEDSTKIGLWFNNEEQGSKVMIRVIQASIGKTLTELRHDVQGCKEEYQDKTKNRLKIIDSAQLSKRDVEKYLETYEPAFIIFDQIDKITGFDADREDLKLGAIYQWARELAKKYDCPVIGVCQADGTGEGVKWLTMQHVANAKTSKQAEADFILGIGKSHDQGYEYVRYLNVSKNKLIGDEDTVGEWRHGRSEVIIEPDVARYRDVMQ